LEEERWVGRLPSPWQRDTLCGKNNPSKGTEIKGMGLLVEEIAWKKSN
jgi:hypothetical protein